MAYGNVEGQKGKGARAVCMKCNMRGPWRQTDNNETAAAKAEKDYARHVRSERHTAGNQKYGA